MTGNLTTVLTRDVARVLAELEDQAMRPGTELECARAERELQRSLIEALQHAHLRKVQSHVV